MAASPRLCVPFLSGENLAPRLCNRLRTSPFCPSITRRAGALAYSKRPWGSKMTMPSLTESMTARTRGEKVAGEFPAGLTGLSIIGWSESWFRVVSR